MMFLAGLKAALNESGLYLAINSLVRAFGYLQSCRCRSNTPAKKT
jgi:hypothetical protein